jgi:hypothetical protein
MIEPKENWMALFNEIMVSAYLYVSMTLTGFNPNPFFNNSGTALMGVIILAGSANLLMFLISASKATFLQCKRNCQKIKKVRKEALKSIAVKRKKIQESTIPKKEEDKATD